MSQSVEGFLLSSRAPMRHAKPQCWDVEALGTVGPQTLCACYFDAMRCDGVNPGLLGMGKIISDDALLNAFKRFPQVE